MSVYFEEAELTDNETQVIISGEVLAEKVKNQIKLAKEELIETTPHSLYINLKLPLKMACSFTTLKIKKVKT